MLKRCVVLISVVMVLFAPQMNASVGAEKPELRGSVEIEDFYNELMTSCLLYTSDAADEMD
jgi:hypothetical protein